MLQLLETTKSNPVSELIEKLNDVQEKQPKRVLVCAQCAIPVTTEQDKTTVNGSFYHTFTNPYGYTFHISCFKEALGCVHEGMPVAADTWFPGYFWRYALCSGCHTHLGWYYTSSGTDYFYGLISNRLNDSGSS